jgi:hypothetical protein
VRDTNGVLNETDMHQERGWGSAWDGGLSRSASHPRGLYLVRKLSSACGSQRGTGRGLVAWFRIDLPAPDAAPVRSEPQPAVVPSTAGAVTAFDG